MAYLEYIPTKPLYHYTSEDGLRGITRSHELWLSDLGTSNDPRDVQLGVETLRAITKQIGEREFSGENAAVLFRITDNILNYFNDSRCYTACFTPYADNINMWREYADAGKGYSIGFKARAITDMHGRIYKVKYIDDNNREDIYNLVSEVVKPIEIYGKQIFNDVEKEIDIGTALISIVNSLKHFSWEYEDEIRLSFASGSEPPPKRMPVSLAMNGREKQWERYKTRNASGKTIRYHSLPFGKFSNERNDPREAVYEIIVGPKANLAEAEVRAILLDGGFSNFTIKKSTCAFR
jgi:hypothetical protein